MITEPATAASPRDARLTTRISEGVDLRLRLAALVQGAQIGQFLDRVLDRALPPVGELAQQIQGVLAMSTDSWRDFGIAGDRSAPRIINVTWRRPKRTAKAEDRPSRPPGSALVSAATGLLGLLAVGLFIVSLAAQFRYVFSAKHQVLPSVIEAVALDLGMVIFSLLALGLARAGQSARIERVLIVVCAVGSAGMNYAAANDGSPRSVAAYVVPPVFLAVVVDRVIVVVRRHVLGDTERSAWSGAGRVALYLLRFLLAMPSTAKGLRCAVLERAPLPHTGTAALSPAAPNVAALTAAPTPTGAVIPPAKPEPEPQVKATRPERTARPRGESKRAQLVAAYEALQGKDARYGDRSQVSPVAKELAPAAGLAWSSARTSLYRHLDARTEASS